MDQTASAVPAGLDQFLASPTAPAPSANVPPSSGAAPAGLDAFVQEEQYGTPEQQALAGIEGAARGATLGGSDIFETGTGLSTQAAIKARMATNPGTSFAGNVLGSGALIGLTGGLAAPVEGAAGLIGAGALAARVAGYTAEGAMFGAGNAVTDAALGDPDLNASKILAHVGMGAALGAGLGVLSKGIEAMPALWRASKAAEDLNAPAPSDVPSPPGSPPEPPTGPAPVLNVEMKGIQPTSFEEMGKRVQDAVNYGGESLERPAAAVLDDALSRVEMANPVHPLQRQSLENQEAQNLYNVARELPGKEGEAIRGMETLQKQELVGKTDKAIKDLSPSVAPTADAVEGGNRASKIFTDQYQTEKKELGPVFEGFKTQAAGGEMDHVPGVIDKITDAVPGVSKMFDTESGNLHILPYSETGGSIDKSTYSAVKEMIGFLDSGEGQPKTVRDLLDARDALKQHVNILDQGKGPAQVRSIQAAMTDYIQNVSDNPAIRDALKRYAINEQERGVIEKVFKASVGSPEFGVMAKGSAESIGDKIFSNTATVNAAKSILPPDKFNQILANWISEAKAAATDKGAFSSNKFGSFLRKNQDALGVAFSDNPAGLQRLKDLTTIMRILPDAPSINPSGTAKTIYSALKDAHGIYDVFKNVAGFAKDKFADYQTKEQVSAALAGKADQSSKLNSIQGIVNRVTKSISSGAKAIFTGNAARGGAIGGADKLTDDEYLKQVNQIKKLNNDPHAMLDHLSGNTEALYAAAPHITQGIHNSMIAGVQFLNSKIPQPSDQMTLSPEWNPSKSQRFKFENYYRAVNDPVSVLGDVKNNSLTNESLEALQSVHPKLLQDMRQKVIEQMNPEDAKDMSYSSKLNLAKFLGQPLDQNMMPVMIAANQATFNAPQLGQQSAPQSGAKTGRGSMKSLAFADRVKTRTAEGDDDRA
jgi:hypothetical protein